MRDEIDRLLVERLRADGRASFVELGRAVGLSAPAVKRRVDRLREEGVIVRFTAVVDPRVLGQGTEVFVELFCSHHTSPGDIQALAQKHAEIVGAFTVSGDADALLHLRTPDIAALERVLELIRSEPVVERTRSTIVLSNFLDDGQA
ncbi:MAG TPA: Lrp/AsnC family transcriptional regulator [Acidimicrobiales bacterium]|nr:Lrp/AsnC family transcriptional regulator [Acidimicrobiales bacterium]